jgi:hypothetical protein
MSSWDALVTKANAGLLSAFGDAVTVVAGGVETVLTGIQSDDLATESGFLPLSDSRHLFHFPAAAFTATGAGHGDTLRVGTNRYRIIDTYSDDGGFVRVTVSRPGVNLP